MVLNELLTDISEKEIRVTITYDTPKFYNAKGYTYFAGLAKTISPKSGYIVRHPEHGYMLISRQDSTTGYKIEYDAIESIALSKGKKVIWHS